MSDSKRDDSGSPTTPSVITMIPGKNNDLPGEIKSIQTKPIFKSKVKQYGIYCSWLPQYLGQVKDMRDQDLSQQIETLHRFKQIGPQLSFNLLSK